MSQTLAYLGPEGTFSEEAALQYAAHRVLELTPYPRIDLVMSAVEKGEAELGIVPVENSLEGSVNITLDHLRDSSVQICGEILLPVRHCLLAGKGVSLEQIREVRSHPQALAQCRRTLEMLLPEIPARAADSTAEAARLASWYWDKGVVASRHAAVLYDLDVLQGDIQDEGGNITRFLILAQADAPPTGDDKTSLLLGLPHRAGSLHGLLGVLARNDLNLTKIESRPVRGDLGKYIFFLDIQGHRRDQKVTRAIEQAWEDTYFIKVLGSYPRAII